MFCGDECLTSTVLFAIKSPPRIFFSINWGGGIYCAIRQNRSTPWKNLIFLPKLGILVYLKGGYWYLLRHPPKIWKSVILALNNGGGEWEKVVFSSVGDLSRIER